MRLYYEAIEQRVSTVKGPFYIGFLCLKVAYLWGPESQIHTRTPIIPFDLIGHRAIDRSQKVDTTHREASPGAIAGLLLAVFPLNSDFFP
jgi:hypothetical protein